MPDYTLHESEQEIREALSDVEDLLTDFKAQQQTLDNQRGELAEQVQGALAEYEKRVGDYEERRDDLDRRQDKLAERRREFDETRDFLQSQLDAKRGNTAADPAASLKAGDQNPKVNQAAPSGPATKADIEKIEAQLSKPKPDLTLDPPGGPSQASTIDKDLKLMAKAREKQERLDDASQNLREKWGQSTKPKR